MALVQEIPQKQQVKLGQHWGTIAEPSRRDKIASNQVGSLQKTIAWNQLKLVHKWGSAPLPKERDEFKSAQLIQTKTI